MKIIIIPSILIFMSVILQLYCFEIVASLKGREPMAVPMTNKTHVLFILWTAITIIGSLAHLIFVEKKLIKTLATISMIISASSLAIWLAMIYLNILLPYRQVHSI